MTTQAPLSWIEQIHEDVSLCKQVPLWGSCPLFPWQALEESLQKTVGITDLRLHSSPSMLCKPEEFLAPFGAKPYTLFLQLSPLQGTLCFVMSFESVEQMTALILANDKAKGLSDPRLQEGFYHFLLLETSLEIEKLKVYPDLHIQWLEEGKIPTTSALTVDISLQIQGETFPARLITSTEFHSSFSEHFIHSASTLIPSNLQNILDVSVVLEVGSCSLPRTEWNTLQIGDLLILDRCSYDPKTETGTAILTFAEKPCFIIKIKKNNLKILDYAVYQGDTHIMDAEKLPEEEKTSIPDTEDDELPPPEEAEPSSSPPPEPLTSPGNIPFPIVVEVERMKMPLEKLLQLTPGNILEMSVRPEQGVYLTVHGKRIARGELIKVGDMLGVKILEMGQVTTS